MINSATYTFWANQFREITGTNAWTKSNIKGYMNTLWLACVRGTDRPDLIVSTNDFYSAYWESLQDIQRFTTEKSEGGYTIDSLRYVTADVVHDLNSNFTSLSSSLTRSPSSRWMISTPRSLPRAYVHAPSVGPLQATNARRYAIPTPALVQDTD